MKFQDDSSLDEWYILADHSLVVMLLKYDASPLYQDTFLFLLTKMIVFSFSFRLVTLAFAGSIGMTLVILGCALPDYK